MSVHNYDRLRSIDSKKREIPNLQIMICACAGLRRICFASSNSSCGGVSPQLKHDTAATSMSKRPVNVYRSRDVARMLKAINALVEKVTLSCARHWLV